MSQSADQWRQIYNLFDPRQRLDLADMDLFVQRPGAVADTIASDLQLNLEPTGKWVLCGSMGSGKSSELVRLGRTLQDTHAVIGLDLASSTGRVDKLARAEILFLIGAGAVRAADELWGHAIPERLKRDLLEAFKGVLAPGELTVNVGELLQGVALFGANLAAPGAGAAAVAVSGAAQGMARAVAGTLVGPMRVSRSVKVGGLTRPLKEGEPDLVRLQSAVDAMLEEVRGYRPPVVLVDGLDKVQEIALIRDLFTTNRILSLPLAPVIYTGPITLMLATEWQTAGAVFKRERLTNIVVQTPLPDWVSVTPEKIRSGRVVLEQVVARRLARLQRTPADVIEPDALDALIDASGGLLRDFIHLVNRAVRFTLVHGSALIDRRSAQAAIEEIRKEYEVTLNGRRVEELRYVREQGEPSGRDAVSGDLLLGGYVLPYSNGKVWFEPHPILRGLRPGL